MRLSFWIIAVIAVCTLVLGGGLAVAGLINPIELQSFADKTAKEAGGCGGKVIREAVLDRLRDLSLKSSTSARPVRINELPGKVVAERFAFHHGEYEKVDLFESNLRRGLRARALEVLVSQETLLDAYCAIGASGRSNGSIADLAKSLGAPVATSSRECEARAVAQVFVELDHYSNNTKLDALYQTYKAQLCD